MTRIFKKIINWFKSGKQFGHPSDELFWDALLDIHWMYFEEVLKDYVETGRSPEHIYHSFSTIGCWLELASENGWINENESSE